MVSRKFARSLIFLILLVGFALRVAVASASLDLPIRADEKDYTHLARLIVQNPLRYDNDFRPPLYPYTLALGFIVFGESRFATGVMHALLATLNIALLYALTQTLFRRRTVSVLSALFLAICPEFIPVARLYLADILFFTLSTLGFWLLLKFYRAPPSPVMVLVGVVFALAALTREVLGLFALLAVPLWIVWTTARTGRQSILNGVLLVVGVLVVLMPWSIRNLMLESRFILISTSGEFNFARDNVRIESKVGLKATVPKNASAMRQMFQELNAIPPARRGAYAYERGMAVIRYNPALWVLVKTRALKSMLNPTTTNMPFIRLQQWSASVQAGLVQLNALFFYSTLLLALLGFLTARDNAPKLLLLGYILFNLLVFIVTHYQPRYRLPLMLLLYPYAAYGPVQLIQWMRAKRTVARANGSVPRMASGS